MILDPESSKGAIEEIKALAPEIYTDLAKPALQEVGSVGGRTVKALLAPIRGLLWGWEKIEESIEVGIKKRFERIPEEQRKSPEPEIAVPLLQALSYTAHNETLREMYLNLLANSMDERNNNVVHPSFVEIIKQMNSLDAKVFEKISAVTSYQSAINPTIEIQGTGTFYTGATPEWYLGWTILDYTEFDVSASLIRLSKFGLIELMFDRTAGKDEYKILRDSQFLISILNFYQSKSPASILEIGGTDSIIYTNEYGKQFKKACM